MQIADGAMKMGDGGYSLSCRLFVGAALLIVGPTHVMN